MKRCCRSTLTIPEVPHFWYHCARPSSHPAVEDGSRRFHLIFLLLPGWPDHCRRTLREWESLELRKARRVRRRRCGAGGCHSVFVFLLRRHPSRRGERDWMWYHPAGRAPATCRAGAAGSERITTSRQPDSILDATQVREFVDVGASERARDSLV